jgi:hippurate hydrolase
VASTYNDPTLTERLATSLRPVLGEANVLRIDPLMVSEDFGLFGIDRKIPTAMLHVGGVDPAKLAAGGPLPALHSSKWAPLPEPTLRTAVRALTTMTLELLKK